MRIEAKSLEDAYLKAAKELNCSVKDLDVKIIQHPSKGFLGLFSKPAIIEVNKKFYEKSKEEVLGEIKEGIKKLFSKSCFNIDLVSIDIKDDVVYIRLDGEDAPLLIGKEGYRYNALNFMMYNWIYQKYGYKVRLEIAEFLKKQEEMLRSFLAPFIEKVKNRGYGKTKPFDGILVFLALEILREAFPNKYVAVREKDGEKFVVIGERYGDNSGNSNS